MIRLSGAGNIGLAINAELEAHPAGCTIELPGGTLQTWTTIDLDLVQVDAPVAIIGQHDTVIDATGWGGDVIRGAQTQYNRNIKLESLRILTRRETAGCRGVVIGTRDYSAAHSTIRNISVAGGSSWGVMLTNMPSSTIDGIRVTNTQVGGIRLDSMNASRIGTIMAREIDGGYAIEIRRGAGWTIDSIYVEACQQAALRMCEEVRSLRIGTIYLEGNNQSEGWVPYEVLLGDYSVSQNCLRRVTIDSIRLAASYSPFATARIAHEHGLGVQIGIEALDTVAAPEVTFQCVNAGGVHGICLANCVIGADRTIDLTHAGRNVTVLNCDTELGTVVDPQSYAVYVGGKQ